MDLSQLQSRNTATKQATDPMPPVGSYSHSSIAGSALTPTPTPTPTPALGSASGGRHVYHDHQAAQPHISLPPPSRTQSHHISPTATSIVSRSHTHPQTQLAHLQAQQHPTGHDNGEHQQSQLNQSPSQLHSASNHQPTRDNTSSAMLNDGQKTLVPLSIVDDATGRRYSLDVVQQPQRARMCGFGDKDRRPITPPPCVRLLITNAVTGKEVDCNDIDHAMFVLNVDLWDASASREVNLVRSSSSTHTTSMSSTATHPYATVAGGDTRQSPYPSHLPTPNRDQVYSSSQPLGYVQDYQVQASYATAPSYPPNGSYGPPQQYYPQHHTYRPDDSSQPLAPQSSMVPYSRNSASVSSALTNYGQDQNTLTRMAMISGPPQGMFTRNLIGSLAASAFRLSDTNDHFGIWFVLQDLSVRTEGPFRLKFSFVNVGPRGGVHRNESLSVVNTGRAPILASCFSDVFHVYSAKKFPGVCESTPLSKTFATQGIKIPIRKDANAKGGDGEDDYGD